MTSLARLHFAAALLDDGQISESCPFAVPVRLRLIVLSLKYSLNVLTLPPTRE
jgi:hypothetical protein